MKCMYCSNTDETEQILTMIRSMVRWAIDKFIQFFKHYEHQDDTDAIKEYNFKNNVNSTEC